MDVIFGRSGVRMGRSGVRMGASGHLGVGPRETDHTACETGRKRHMSSWLAGEEKPALYQELIGQLAARAGVTTSSRVLKKRRVFGDG
jgi:hypothetical protein